LPVTWLPVVAVTISTNVPPTYSPQMISKQGYLIWKGTLEKQKWHHWNQSKAMASCTKGWFVRHWHQCMMWMGRLVPFSRNAYGYM